MLMFEPLLLSFLFLLLSFTNWISIKMDHKNKISKLCKNSNHVLKLQIDENIMELLLKELKVKQKILNKQMNKSKLRKKKLH